MLVENQQLAAVVRSQGSFEDDAHRRMVPREELVVPESLGDTLGLKLLDRLAHCQRVGLCKEVRQDPEPN